MAVEQILISAMQESGPYVRMTVKPADIPKLYVGLIVQIQLVTGTANELDGDHFPIVLVEAAAFSIVCAIGPDTDLTDCTGVAAFEYTPEFNDNHQEVSASPGPGRDSSPSPGVGGTPV
jgi:hypothetical protein